MGWLAESNGVSTQANSTMSYSPLGTTVPKNVLAS